MTGAKPAIDPVNPKEKHFYHDLKAREGVMHNLLEVSDKVYPDKLRLSRSDLPADLQPGSEVAKITVLGGTAPNFTLALAEGLGDAHNDSFRIEGDSLVLKDNGPPLPAGPISIRLRAIAANLNGIPDGTGVFRERIYSLWRRKAGEEPITQAQAFDPGDTAGLPPLTTPRPNRIH